ncbi:hypothetical protein [Kordiimonas marina]|uniref:hypothetical protein n=1 Tax=Kordiimonas marina TaxID=2872312 RepID=UPI001FF52CC1|nr:hypothetical protein [Kordiimonas marina]MCJ9430146.1 hypothetical protein [Kordiimonas marina]
MKLARTVLAVILLSACTPAGTTHDSRASTGTPTSLLALLGSTRTSGSNCALYVRRDGNLLLMQKKVGAPALVQRDDGRHTLPLKDTSGPDFGGFPAVQHFADDSLTVKLSLTPEKGRRGATGTLSVLTPEGLTAILPVTASLTCFH